MKSSKAYILLGSITLLLFAWALVSPLCVSADANSGEVDILPTEELPVSLYEDAPPTAEQPASAAVNSREIDSVPAQELSAQELASRAYNELHVFFNEGSPLLEKQLTTWPEYYCGAYWKDDSLVIQVNEQYDFDQTVEIINSAIESEANLTFEAASYSYSYLSRLITDVSKKLNSYRDAAERPSIIDCIGVVSLREDFNRVYITIAKLDEQKEKEFKEYVSDSPAILLVYVEELSIARYY